jgi:PAS domain S-box-containing protein
VVNAPTEQTPEERASEILDALQRHGAWSGEVHNRRKDGTRFWSQANISRFEHPSHGPVWVTAQNEIGGRKAAEEALQQAEERFRTVFEQGPMAIVLVGRDMQLVDFNDTFCSMLGYRREELVGMPMAALAHPDDGDLDADLLARLFDGALPRYRVAKRYVTRDGKAIPVTITATAARGTDGRPLYAITTVEDTPAL